MQRTSSICCMKAIGHFGSKSPTSYILNVQNYFAICFRYTVCFPHGVERMISVFYLKISKWVGQNLKFEIENFFKNQSDPSLDWCWKTLEQDLEETKIRTENCVFLLLITFCNNSVTMFIFRTRPPPISQLTSTISLLSPPHHLTSLWCQPEPSSRPSPPPPHLLLQSQALLCGNKILPCLK